MYDKIHYKLKKKNKNKKKKFIKGQHEWLITKLFCILITEMVYKSTPVVQSCTELNKYMWNLYKADEFYQYQFSGCDTTLVDQ